MTQPTMTSPPPTELSPAQQASAVSGGLTTQAVREAPAQRAALASSNKKRRLQDLDADERLAQAQADAALGASADGELEPSSAPANTAPRPSLSESTDAAASQNAGDLTAAAPEQLWQLAQADPGLQAASGGLSSAMTTPSPAASWSLPLGLGLGAVALAAAAGHSRAQPAGDTTAPALQGVSANAALDTLTLSFNEALAGRLPPASAFEVVQAGRTLAVSRLTASGQRLSLELAGDLQDGAFTLRYTDPSAGNDELAIQDTSGNDAPSLWRGLVADGYIFGAQLYLDANGDGQPSPDEDTGVRTALDGSFELSGSGPLLSLPLLAAGGINTDTGLANAMLLRAPAGALVLNPLSTVLEQMVRNDTASGTAADKLVRATVQMGKALGLPEGLELSQYDPLSDPTPTGLQAQKAAAQVAALLTAAASSPTQAQAALSHLAAHMSAASSVNLADEALVRSTLTRAGLGESANFNATVTQLIVSLSRLAEASSLTALSQAQWSAAGGSASTDSQAPTVVISTSGQLLKGGEQAVLAFAFNQPVQGFELSDVSISNASLTDLQALPGGQHFWATLTPSSTATGAIGIALAEGSYRNAQGLAGAAGAGPDGLRVDNQAPLPTLSAAQVALGVGQSTTVSLRADEALSMFKGERITAVNGTLGAWSLAGGEYTASFTPTPGLQSTTGLVLVPRSALADLAGNPGSEAGLSLSIDTLPPGLAMGLSKSALKAGESTTLTLNFSEPVRSLALSDISSPDGVISALASSLSSPLSSPDQRVFTATFTPHADVENASARIFVARSAYQDLMGNPGTQDSSIELALDTRPPTLSITSSAGTVIAGQTAVLSFAFSEPVLGFALGGAVVLNGTLSALQASADGKTYTATYTPPLDFPGTSASVAVAAAAYTDLGGNPGAAASLSLTVDTSAPQVRSVAANASSNTVTLSFDSALSSASVPLAQHFSIVQGEHSFGVRSDGVSLSSNELRLTVDGDLREGMFTLVYAPASTPGTPHIQDLRGNAAGGFMRGIVADGYIRGAAIYIDSNRNGLADAGEFTGVRTGLDGSFVLPTQALTGPLMAVGGINTDTGLPNTTALTAPLGAMLLNPLTTVVQHMVSADTGAQSPADKALAAAGKLAQSLGLSLPQGMSLLSYNPLAASDAGALGVQKAAAQLATLLQLAAPDSQAQQSQLLQALAGTVAAQAEGAAPLALAQETTLQTLLALASGSLQASTQSLSQALGSIASLTPEGGLASISQAQSSLLDRTAPAAPVVKMILPSALGLAASVTLDLVTGPSDGSSASAGDRLTLTLPDGALIVHTLSQADISASRVTLALPNATSSQGLQAQLTDLAGNTSTLARYAAPGDDTLELAAVLGPQIMVMLQTLANQELPLIGSLNEVAAVLWEQVSDMLARIPTARWVAAPKLGPMPLLGISLEQLEGDYVVQFDDYTGNETSPLNGGEVDTDHSADPFGELGPTADDGTPQSGSDSGNAPSPDVNYTRTLVGRSSGTQYNLPVHTAFWPSAFSLQPDTGVFSFKYTLPMRLLDLPMLGELGIDGAYARIDANLGAYVSAEIDLQGTLSASQVMVLDTTQSKLEFYINAGLSQGSMMGGELGPLTVIGTDINSVQADHQAQRKNTGLEGTVTIGLVDNDGTANNRLNLDATTVGKLLNELPTKTFKLSDWYSLKASLQGRLSAQLLAQLDLSPLALQDLSPAELSTLGVPDALLGTADAVNGFLSQLTGMLGIFSPQISTKLTVPVSLNYDSTDASADLASYGKVYFDDIRIGADTVLRQTLGSGLDMLDKVMSPVYMINDLLSSPLPMWPQDPLPPLIDPDLLNSWPGFVEDVILSVGNAPSDLLNSMLGTVKSTLDRNQDNSVSLFESMRGMVDLYQAMALDMGRLWTAFTVLPGAEKAMSAALTAAGLPGGSVSAVFEAVAATVTRPAATPGNPNPQSPMEQLQGALDMTAQALAAIDQLQGLRAQYDAAMGQMQEYALANPESALNFSLGSFVWDVANNAITQTHNAYAKKPIDYIFPPGYDAIGESVVTRAQAIALIYNTVKEGKASPLTLSVGLFEKAGVDFSQYGSYTNLNFKGVTAENLEAICDILNTKRSSAFTADWSTAVDADAAKFTADLDEVIQYQRLYRLTSGQGDFTGWNASSMGDTFRALGVATDQDKYQTFPKMDGVPELSGYKYGGAAAAWILDDIVRLQASPNQIDSFKEIKAIWELSRKIEDLGFNLTVSTELRGYGNWKLQGPNKDSRNKYFLNADDFATLGLPILSGEAWEMTKANTLLRDWVLDEYTISSAAWQKPSDFAKLIDHAATFINTVNDIYRSSTGTNGSTLSQAALQKIMAFADVSNGGNGSASGMSLTDFNSLGVKSMTSVLLPLFSDLLATAEIGRAQVNSVSQVQTMVDALQTLAKAVNDQTVDAKKFHDAMKTLLGDTPVQKMEYIPRAHTGGMADTYSTDTLPLLQSVLVARNFDEVDSYRELSNLFDLTEKILLTSMSDASIWKKYNTFSLPAGRSEETDINYGSGYSSTLTANELKLLGFESANTVMAQALSTAVKQHNVTGRTYKFNDYQSFWTTSSTVAELGQPLTMKVLGQLVGDSSQDGFMAELIAKVPWLKTMLSSLSTAGFKTPFLSDPALLQKLWLGEPVDFLTFDPDLSSLTFNPTAFNLLNLDLLRLAGLGNSVVQAPLQVSAEISVVPRLSFGVDSGGILELMELNAQREGEQQSSADVVAATKALLNGFYIRDEYFQGGNWVDLPELDISLMLSGMMGLQVGSPSTLAEAYGQVSAGLDLGVSLDLANADESGKVRLADLFGDLLSDPLSVLNVGADLDLTLLAKAGAALRLPENNSSLLGFLGAAAELVYGAREFKWGPAEVDRTFAIIDSQGVDAPSLAELMRAFTAPAVM